MYTILHKLDFYSVYADSGRTVGHIDNLYGMPVFTPEDGIELTIDDMTTILQLLYDIERAGMGEC